MTEKDYNIDDLPYNCRRIARRIGIDSLIGLTEAVGGEYLFIPKKENLLKYFRVSQMKRDRKTGMTYKQLSQKYDLSKDSVRRILKK